MLPAVHPVKGILLSRQKKCTVKPRKDVLGEGRAFYCKKPTEEATYCAVPAMWHAGERKGKTLETIGRRAVAGASGRGLRV